MTTPDKKRKPTNPSKHCESKLILDREACHGNTHIDCSVLSYHFNAVRVAVDKA